MFHSSTFLVSTIKSWHPHFTLFLQMHVILDKKKSVASLTSAHMFIEHCLYKIVKIALPHILITHPTFFLHSIYNQETWQHLNLPNGACGV